MALAIDPASVDSVSSIERLGPASPPFGLETGSPPFGLSGVPVKVWLPGRRAPRWRLVDGSAPTPPRNVEAVEQDAPIPLVPYGSARSRIAEFPLASPSSLGRRAADEAPP
jgi:hypothetical protein